MNVCGVSEWDASITDYGTTPPQVITYPDSEYRFTQYQANDCTHTPDFSGLTNLKGDWAWTTQPINKGDWDESWDTWLGDFGGCHPSGRPEVELMAYTRWRGNVYAPTAMANFTTSDGTNYDAWWSWRPNGTNCNATNGCIYLQTRMTSAPLNSGTYHLKQQLSYMAAHPTTFSYSDGTNTHALIDPHELVADVQYGVELVTDTNTEADCTCTFHLSNFAVTAN
jgi:hypothetical protein